MQCKICWANTMGFIGSDCRCVPGDDENPVDGVTVNGVFVTQDDVIVTHNPISLVLNMSAQQYQSYNIGL